ncbi:hypothetical protein [Rhizobium rhizogenes]|uniref:hypothetical protein n=1 Tax=Rhizobium rhizogenes TaxID=359 RepID=UPI0022C37A14|nr:hypothetical protein [Rhizobium rhizogenes]MCZ7466408.1 hypothetical protein [Rhizobium rhizogenes]
MAHKKEQKEAAGENLAVQGDDELGTLHFDPWLTCKGEALRRLADDIFEALPQPAITPGRKPRADAEQRRRRCVSGVVANVASMVLSPASHDALATPLRKPTSTRTRYDYSGYSVPVLSATITAMRKAGFLVVIKGVRRRHRTRILPSSVLSAMLDRADIGLEDVGRDSGGETIILRVKRPPRYAEQEDPEEEATPVEQEADELGWVNYEDTAHTVQLRGQMETINEALNRLADVRFDGKSILPIHLVRIFTAMSAGGPHGFNLHGRLYRGGFWLTLPKEKRHLITINGEQIADLDFSSMFFRLAYLQQGIAPPEGDLYGIPGLEGHRQAVKQLVASLFARAGPAVRMPKEVRKEMPKGWTMPRFVKAMAVKHSAIAPLFGTGKWFSFAYTESQIMVDVLLALMALGVPALPMHDGLMVGKSHGARAAQVMREVSLKHLGVELPVSEKPLSGAE